MNPIEIAESFLQALAANDPGQSEALLHDDVALRLWRWDGMQAHRGRHFALAALRAEWAAWPDALLELGAGHAAGSAGTVEFRIQATEGERYVEHNRAASLTIDAGRIRGLTIYCPAPLPSARRHGWIAPPTVDEAALHRLFAAHGYLFDLRHRLPPRTRVWFAPDVTHFGTGDPHPRSNRVLLTRWTEEEADGRIEALIAFHRERGIGFTWYVGPYDRPHDLGARLEARGLVRAGEQFWMARVGLAAPEIPANPRVTIEVLDGSDEAAVEATAQIVGAAFNQTEAQTRAHRRSLLEDVRDAALREREINFLARLDGEPAAHGRLILEGGIAFLGGAATHPALRGQRLYTTLLRHRLTIANERGYHVAVIQAMPMSRAIVARYGFRDYGSTTIYGWMPKLDMAVVRTLVPGT